VLKASVAATVDQLSNGETPDFAEPLPIDEFITQTSALAAVPGADRSPDPPLTKLQANLVTFGR
jgi:hypothetical protein